MSNCNNLDPTPAEHDEHDKLVQPSGNSTTEVSSPNELNGDYGEPDVAKLSSLVDQNKAAEHPGDHCDGGQPSHTLRAPLLTPFPFSPTPTNSANQLSVIYAHNSISIFCTLMLAVFCPSWMSLKPCAY